MINEHVKIRLLEEIFAKHFGRENLARGGAGDLFYEGCDEVNLTELAKHLIDQLDKLVRVG